MKLTNMFLSCLAVAVVGVTSSCNEIVKVISEHSGDVVVASGPSVQQVRELSPINELSVMSGLTAYYVQSDSLKIIVEAPREILSCISTEVSDKELKIYPTKSFRGSDAKVSVTVMAPDVSEFEASSGSSLQIADSYLSKSAPVSIEVSSGASFAAATMVAPSLEIELSSGASGAIGRLTSDKFEAEASSGASLAVSGTAKIARLQAGGGASIGASGLIAGSGSAKASGGAAINCNIKNPVVSSSGGASVNNK